MTPVISNAVPPGRTFLRSYSKDSLPFLCITGRSFWEKKREKEIISAFVWVRELFKKWTLKIFLLQPSTKRGRKDVFVYL